MPINSDSVELFPFSFFENLKYTIPHPNNILLSVCTIMSGCAVCSKYTHFCRCVIWSTPTNIISSIVQISNFNIRFSSFLSSWSLFETLVHRNYIAVLVLGIALFATHNNFDKIEWNVSDSYSDGFSKSSFTYIRWFLESGVTGCDMY